MTGPIADGVVAKMGTRMTCSECGAENEPDARFCRACATALGSRPNPDSEVRKVVTVLFSDVTDSTRLGQDLDPESLRRLVSRYFDEMRMVLERHGGMVEKFIGDAVMAVFGVPKVHEDDALRAVRAALEMRDELRRLNDGVPAGLGSHARRADRPEHRRGHRRRSRPWPVVRRR